VIQLQTPPTDAGRRLLVLGAHSDDIEIGCGGTILSWLRDRPVEVTWVVFGAAGVREAEARASAGAFLEDAQASRVEVFGFRDGFFPYIGGEVKEAFEGLKASVAPDVILTHRRDDLHQDHRTVAELTYNTFRDHLVLEYEIVKYDGDLSSPNVFVPLEGAVLERKIELLMQHFGSQRGKHWFDAETFRGLARIRGLESASPTRYAEGFYGRKVLLGL
jgi:LmbE family N-acetylglucosaminyl deacetylase